MTISIAYRWDKDRIRRFIRDWDDGLAGSALREKYGIASVGRIAESLRRAGYTLTVRRGGREKLSFRRRP